MNYKELFDTNFNEFLIKIKELETEDYYNSIPKFINEIENSDRLNDLVFKNVYSIGGCEGGGEQVSRVYEIIVNYTKFRPPGKTYGWEFSGTSIGFIATSGYYTSENGTEWDEEVIKVYPKEVMVTKYFPVE